MKPAGILPKIAGVPDVAKLERELREWMTRVEKKIDALVESTRPMDDRG